MENDINEPFLHYKDEENDGDIEKEIAQKIRGGFITKVYGILIYQILLTTLVVFLAYISSSFKYILLTSYFLYFLSIVIFLVCLFLPLCKPTIYQQVPTNYIVLTIFTLGYSWTVAAMTCIYSFSSVMVALFLTFVMVVSLTIYAMRTEKDFTVRGGCIFTSCVLLIFFTIIWIFISIPFFYLVCFYLTLILCCAYIIYDTQLIIGEKGVKFKEDDYILAAINIYLDVIMLFLKILSIVGKKDNN